MGVCFKKVDGVFPENLLKSFIRCIGSTSDMRGQWKLGYAHIRHRQNDAGAGGGDS